MDSPPIRRRSELKPAVKFVLKQKTQVGRLEGLRGMAWAYAVLHHTGLSASTASKKFSSKIQPGTDNRKSLVINNHMYKFLKGERAPINAPTGKYKFNLVEAVDKDPLGHLATKWLTLPLWDILHPLVTIQEIRKYLGGLPKEFTSVAFSHISTNTLFNRIEDPRAALRVLYKQGTLQAYTAVLALLRESHLTGNRTLNEHAWSTHRLMLTKMLNEQVFKLIHQPFLHYVEAFNGFHNVTPTSEKIEKEPLTGLTWSWTSRFGDDPYKYLYLLIADD